MWWCACRESLQSCLDVAESENLLKPITNDKANSSACVAVDTLHEVVQDLTYKVRSSLGNNLFRPSNVFSANIVSASLLPRMTLSACSFDLAIIPDPLCFIIRHIWSLLFWTPLQFMRIAHALGTALSSLTSVRHYSKGPMHTGGIAWWWLEIVKWGHQVCVRACWTVLKIHRKQYGDLYFIKNLDGTGEILGIGNQRVT